MPDPSTVPAPSVPARSAANPPVSRRHPLVPLLWAVLAAAVVLNVLSSAGVLPLAVGIGCGLVTLGCAAALVGARIRRR